MPYLTPCGRLFYERAGDGDPPLVFVHGIACAHDDWRALAGLLPRTAMRGRLRSARPWRLHWRPGAVRHRDLRADVRPAARLDLPPGRPHRAQHGLSRGPSGLCRCGAGGPVWSWWTAVAWARAIRRWPSRLPVSRSRRLATPRSCEASSPACSWRRAIPPSRSESSAVRWRAKPSAPPCSSALSVGCAGDGRGALARVGVPLLVIQSTYVNPQRVRVSLEPGASTPGWSWYGAHRPDRDRPRRRTFRDAGKTASRESAPRSSSHGCRARPGRLAQLPPRLATTFGSASIVRQLHGSEIVT